MADHPLKVVATDSSIASPQPSRERSARVELQAKMERLWLIAPEQFDPTRNCIERERVERTSEVLRALSEHTGLAADLGCGYGEISRRMQSQGWTVQGVDIASNALKAFAERGAEGIRLIQDAMPSTKLPDDSYNLVVCTEVIAYLPARDHRLFMAELSRLVKKDGSVVCSTPIDINSVDALARFGELAETEFQIERWRFSHHLLLLRLKGFFEIPQEFVKASKDAEYRRWVLSQRSSFSRWWYQLNTTKIAGYFWQPFKWLAAPVVHLMKNNRAAMLFLEKICRFFWDEAGISHAIFAGKRRPLIPPTQADLESVERKGKRQVWE